MDRRTREIVPWWKVTSKRDDKPLGKTVLIWPPKKEVLHWPNEEGSLALTSEEGSLRMNAAEGSRDPAS
jgi:hypothetical protein